MTPPIPLAVLAGKTEPFKSGVRWSASTQNVHFYIILDPMDGRTLMRDTRISWLAGRVQILRHNLAGLALTLLFGLPLLSTGCVRPDQGFPLGPSQNHVWIPSLASVVQAVMPAVVHVSAVQIPDRTTTGEDAAGIARAKYRGADRGLPPKALEQLLRRFFDMPKTAIRSTGSGFLVDPEGYIVTEDHVVENAEKTTVTLQGGKPLSARIIGRDPKIDLALLKIDVDHPLPYVGWGDSDTAQIGDWVVAIGNPFGLDGTVSSGINFRTRPRHASRPLRRFPADRCGDQPRKFRGPHLRPQWQGDRHQYGHLLAE
jgi:S1-C subfamily serine protease